MEKSLTSEAYSWYYIVTARASKPTERKGNTMREYTNERDPGKNGKNAEPNVRFYLNPKTKLDGCNPLGTDDIQLYDKTTGKRLVIEVKTGSGTLEYNASRFDLTQDAQAHAESLLTGIDLIAYAPEYNGPDTVGEDFWMFTREQFISYLTGYKTKTGKPADMVKYTDKSTGKAINLQEMNSPPKQNYLWATLENLPTLAEWKAANR